MGFEELIQAIGGQTGPQREELLSRALEEARAILARAETQVPDEVREAMARAEAAAREEASRVLSRARLQARREVQAARHRVLEQMTRALEERLARLPAAPEYPRVIEALLAECLAEAAEPVLVRCRREDRATVEESARRLGRAVGIEEADLPLGGVETVSGPGGRFVCRNSLGDRLRSVHPLVLQKGGACLFGQPAGGTPP